MLYKKGVLKNFTKFTRKHLCQNLFFNKVAGLRPATFLKKRFWHRCFPVNFAKFSRTRLLQNPSGRLLLNHNITFRFHSSKYKMRPLFCLCLGNCVFIYNFSLKYFSLGDLLSFCSYVMMSADMIVLFYLVYTSHASVTYFYCVSVKYFMQFICAWKCLFNKRKKVCLTGKRSSTRWYFADQLRIQKPSKHLGWSVLWK